MLGTLNLPHVHDQFFTVFGGPIREAPEGSLPVKMAAEISVKFDHISIPTRDFSVPSTPTLNIGLEQAVSQILKGEPVYVGCMAGKGRTGLFLSILAKTFGVDQPVEYVRANYYAHAVETKEQYQFVMDYVVPSYVVTAVQKSRSKWKFRNWFGKLARTREL